MHWIPGCPSMLPTLTCSCWLFFQESEAWGAPQFQEKRSRSEKAIHGALGGFLGILGATLGGRNSILGIQNSILRMASHDLSNAKTTVLGATLAMIPGFEGNTNEMFSFAPPFSERFFKNWGGPRAPERRGVASLAVMQTQCAKCRAKSRIARGSGTGYIQQTYVAMS